MNEKLSSIEQYKLMVTPELSSWKRVDRESTPNMGLEGLLFESRFSIEDTEELLSKISWQSPVLISNDYSLSPLFQMDGFVMPAILAVLRSENGQAISRIPKKEMDRFIDGVKVHQYPEVFSALFKSASLAPHLSENAIKKLCYENFSMPIETIQVIANAIMNLPSRLVPGVFSTLNNSLLAANIGVKSEHYFDGVYGSIVKEIDFKNLPGVFFKDLLSENINKNTLMYSESLNILLSCGHYKMMLNFIKEKIFDSLELGDDANRFLMNFSRYLTKQVESDYAKNEVPKAIVQMADELIGIFQKAPFYLQTFKSLAKLAVVLKNQEFVHDSLENPLCGDSHVVALIFFKDGLSHEVANGFSGVLKDSFRSWSREERSFFVKECLSEDKFRFESSSNSSSKGRSKEVKILESSNVLKKRISQISRLVQVSKEDLYSFCAEIYQSSFTADFFNELDKKAKETKILESVKSQTPSLGKNRF